MFFKHIRFKRVCFKHMCCKLIFFNRRFYKFFLILKLFVFISFQGLTHEPGGWLWYKDPVHVPVIKNPTQRIPKTSTIQNPKQMTAQQKMAQQREAYDESLAQAILKPSLENMRRVQHMQRFILDQATSFQDSWMASEALMRPFESQDHNPAVRDIRNQKEKRGLEFKLKTMAQTYGLFFIISSTCQYCHLFAPLVRDFANFYGFDIQAISSDGKGIPEFPKPLPDNGIINAINPQGFYPSLFFVNKKTQQIIPLAQSLLNKDELLENAKYILRYLESHP